MRLGKLKLRWCHECNLPILDEARCGACGAPTSHVTLTPPGDVRPARPVEVRRIREVADAQFGPGSGRALVPDDEAVVVLNKAPALDRMDEVIMDGSVVATLRYDPLAGWRLLPRLEGASRIVTAASRGLVGLAGDAVPFIEGGASVLAPGVVSASPSIAVGDDVIVVDPKGEVVAVGTARLSGEDMAALDRGVCVKVRHHRREGQTPSGPGPLRTWDDAMEANRAHVERMVERGKAFVLRVLEEEGLPLAVSFSGGKDSLAALLIVLEAGLRPPVVFVDTGIELPGTVEHVRQVASRHGLELVLERTDHDFVNMSGVFGPPSRDYRWCCKTQKLGPVARALNGRFPGGMITIIGQRRYESGPRSRSGAVWRNPWVPGQVGASPIQDWTALHVWLLLRMRGEDTNPWYDLGLERIGCYPCPATDLADLELVEANFPGYARWRSFLEEWARATGRDDRWVDLGMWRFRRIPKDIAELAQGFPVGREPPRAMTLRTEGRPEEVDGTYEARGRFDRRLDLRRASELLNVIGEASIDAAEGTVTVAEGRVTASEDGTLVARGRDAGAAAKLLDLASQLVVKAELCVGCAVCVPRCPSGALTVEGMTVRLDGDECTHCRSCLGPCAVVDFPPVVVEMGAHDR